MRIAHFSDPHAGASAEEFSGYFDKRIVGIFNYRFRRCYQHDLSELGKAVEYIMANDFDLVICTGDLTSAGQAVEFEKVRPYLKPLRDSKIPVIYTPGNHDCYVNKPSCIKAVNEMVHYLSRGDYEFSDMPFVRKYDGLEFLVFNTSRPSNLLCSWGFVDKKDSDFIVNYCAGEKTCPRILVNHYPIIEEHPFLRVRHRLFGQSEILKLIKNGRIDLSLHGHVHRPYSNCDASGRGEYCSGSVTKNAMMTEIEYTDDKFIFKPIKL